MSTDIPAPQSPAADKPASPAETNSSTALGAPFGAGLTLSGMAIVAVFLVTFSGWSMLAPLEGAVVAPGVVSVDTNVKTVQHLEGGIVEEILVREGDRVAAGDVLFRLQDTLPASILNELQAQYFEARATEARLVAERDGKFVIAFPEDLRIKVADRAAREAISGQQNIFESRRKLLSEQLKILERTVAGLEAEIIGLEGQIAAAQRQIFLVDDELGGALALLKQGLTGKPRVLELQRKKAELEGAVSSYVASIGAARQRIEEAHLGAAELQASAVFEVADQLREVRSLVYELEQKLAAAEDVVLRTEIHSPIDGVVVGLKVHTVGGVISAGEPLLDIVPTNEELVVQASIDQLDIDQVEVGLPVTVWFWALNRRNRAALEGTLKTISADRLIDPNTGAAYYLARVELNADSPEFRTVALHTGMSADVLIRTGARTPWEYLIAPISRSLALALREE